MTNSIYWSEEMFRLYRFDPDAGVPSLERIRALVHPEDREEFQRVLDAATQSGERYELDVRLLFENGDQNSHTRGRSPRTRRGRQNRPPNSAPRWMSQS